MPAHFFDTCAIVYRYFQAPETEAVDGVLAGPGPHFVSLLGVVEFHSVFAKLVRSGKIGSTDFDLTVQAFDSDVAAGLIRVVTAKKARHSDATRLIRMVGMTAELSSQDALQLAVALQLRATFPALKLVTCDHALTAAAAAVQLPTVYP